MHCVSAGACIGQRLQNVRGFPPRQIPASDNLDQVVEAMQSAKHISHAGE